MGAAADGDAAPRRHHSSRTRGVFVSSRIVVSGPPVDQSEEILTPAALDFLADLHDRFAGAPRRTARRCASCGGTPSPSASRWTSCAETAEIRSGDWTRRADPGLPGRPAGGDHRPDRPQDDDQRAELGRQDLAGRPGGRQHPRLGERHLRAGQSAGRDPAHHRAGSGRQVLPAERRRARGDRHPAARLAPAGEAPDDRRRAAGRCAGRLRAVLLPQRRRTAGPRGRAGVLPAEDGVPSGGAALGRGVRLRRVGARASSRAPSGPPC